DLEMYLNSYGYEEGQPEARKQRNEMMLKAARFGEKLLEAIGDGRTRGALADLYYLVQQAERGSKGRRKTVAFPLRLEVSSALGQLLTRLDAVESFPGLTIESQEAGGSVVTIPDLFSLGSLGGTWLEAVVYKRLSKAFRGVRNVQVVAGLDVRLEGRKRSLTDFDILIFGNDRLDLVEVKAVIGLDGLKQEQVTKLADYKRRLSGPAGRAWLVAPLVEYGHDDHRDLSRNAEQVAVTLLTGPSAVNRLVQLVVESRINAKR
ncbi:MAG: DUF1887 family CARF protein, partial [Desulfobacterales bacterium]|nr:DUF1887 family CARF protein [Desulfobacterales bacterium]